MRFALAFVLLIGGSAIAAPPPFGTWLRLRVTSCQAVTFAAPDDPTAARTQGYSPGETLRATLVVGEVLAAKNFSPGGKWIFNFRPPAADLAGREYVAFISEPRSSSCPSTVPGELEFIRLWDCDVGRRANVCLPPLPQVRLVQPGETFEFVSDR
ncbi:MAG: hypothetical protein KF686_18850 [Ramlibacter sp.]|nr:hypothetical protein [Ramlibacter sp.]